MQHFILFWRKTKKGSEFNSKIYWCLLAGFKGKVEETVKNVGFCKFPINFMFFFLVFKTRNKKHQVQRKANCDYFGLLLQQQMLVKTKTCKRHTPEKQTQHTVYEPVFWFN